MSDSADVRVQRAGLGDVQGLAAEYERTAGADIPEPALPRGAMFWIATVDGEPAGYAAGERSPAGLALGPVYVAQAHRRRRVGERLLEEIERWASGTSIVEVSVAAGNDTGIRFLTAEGYQPRRILMARSDGAGSGPVRAGTEPAP